MDGSRRWKTYLWTCAGLLGVVVLGTPAFGAGSEKSTVEEMPRTAQETPSSKVSQEELVEALRQSWEEIRESLMRCALESTMILFFGRAATAPPEPSDPTGSGSTPPPPETDDGGTPPPPPDGQGEEPPPDVITDPPFPNDAPEPASIVSALVGAGIASWVGWRNRRKRASPLSARRR